MACSHNHCFEMQQCFLFIVSGIDVAVNNINVYTVDTEIQHWIPFALLSNYKVFHTAAP